MVIRKSREESMLTIGLKQNRRGGSRGEVGVVVEMVVVDELINQ